MQKPRLLAAGGLLIALGLIFAVLPKQWIEEVLGFEPDAGSGLLEFALASIPIIIGAACIAVALVRAGGADRQAPWATARDRDGEPGLT